MNASSPELLDAPESRAPARRAGCFALFGIALVLAIGTALLIGRGCAVRARRAPQLPVTPAPRQVP